MAETAGAAAGTLEDTSHSPHSESFFALALGSMGVVFGDIGTSPLYAMREALHHTRATVDPQLAVLGVVSLVIWALTDNDPAVEFYRALGGRAIARSSERFGQKTLDKVAFGWQP